MEKQHYNEVEVNNKMEYASLCRGTLGELYQGPIFEKNSVDISIISALSNNSTKTKLVVGKKCNLEDINKFKVKKALNNFFKRIGVNNIEGFWTFESDIKIGAGMSSSTSDIVSALRCVSSVLNRTLTVKDITEATLNVERSDSVFIDFPCLYLSQNQSFVDIYKPQNTIHCIYGTENTKVDTTETRNVLIQYYKKNKLLYSELIDKVQKAFHSSDIHQIIENSTQSAILSQGILPKRNFWFFHSNYKNLNANGLIIAHTGTLIGLLYAEKPNEQDISLATEFISSQGLEVNLGTIF